MARAGAAKPNMIDSSRPFSGDFLAIGTFTAGQGMIPGTAHRLQPARAVEIEDPLAQERVCLIRQARWRWYAVGVLAEACCESTIGEIICRRWGRRAIAGVPQIRPNFHVKAFETNTNKARSSRATLRLAMP
jgi:hypothetical protein